MFGRDPVVLGMESMFEPKRRYLGDKNAMIDLQELHKMHMQIAVRLQKARQKAQIDDQKVACMPQVGDAVLIRNHHKTGLYSNFLPGYRVVEVVGKNNFVVKHTVSGKTSQLHLRDIIVSPMIRQVLQNLPPEDTFGRRGKFANCPQMANAE